MFKIHRQGQANKAVQEPLEKFLEGKQMRIRNALKPLFCMNIFTHVVVLTVNNLVQIILTSLLKLTD